MPQTVEFIKALTALAWPLILAVLLWKIFPALKTIITSKGFSVKIAGMEVSVQDATEQIRTQIEDVQKQVMSLRSATSGGAEPTTSEAPRAAQSTKGRPFRILWVDD